MKTSLVTIILFISVGLINGSTSIAHELSGYLATEGRVFFNDALFPDQERYNASIAFQPEYYHEWENGTSFVLS